MAYCSLLVRKIPGDGNDIVVPGSIPHDNRELAPDIAMLFSGSKRDTRYPSRRPSGKDFQLGNEGLLDEDDFIMLYQDMIVLLSMILDKYFVC